MPLRELRDSLGQRVDAAHFADAHTIITKNGQARAVLISFETWQELMGKVDVNRTETE